MRRAWHSIDTEDESSEDGSGDGEKDSLRERLGIMDRDEALPYLA